MKFVKLVIAILFVSFFVGCGSHHKITKASGKSTSIAASNKKKTEIKNTPVPKEVQEIPEADLVVLDLLKRKPNLNESTLNYIKEYNDIAILEMISYEIPASITLAQGILESQSGNSRLSVKGNNHFGVKCHKSWKGKRLYHDDDARQECFRKYDHPLSSFRDHSLFLYGRDRYAALFELDLKDYKGWARGLKKAGYATDPKYPHKLINLIEMFELYRYDDFNEDFRYGGKVVKVSNETYTKNDYVIVSKGDTLYSIAKANNLSVDKLKWLNGLKSNEIAVGQKLYLK